MVRPVMRSGYLTQKIKVRLETTHKEAAGWLAGGISPIP